MPSPRWGNARRTRCLITAAIAGLAASNAQAGLLSSHRVELDRNTTRLGDWELAIAHNPFADSIVCRLRARDHRIFFEREAVGFRFNAKWDVSHAVYRLDGGSPRASRDDLPALISVGTPIDRGGMDNASRGIVWIPFERLEQVNSVRIAARPNHQPKTFHLRGLNALHAIAVARGCVPESRFVER